MTLLNISDASDNLNKFMQSINLSRIYDLFDKLKFSMMSISSLLIEIILRKESDDKKINNFQKYIK